MIIVRLKGGMGNQMFQYATGLSIAKKLNVELKLDLSSLLDRSKGDFVYREYDLSIFNINPKIYHSTAVLKTLAKLKSSIITKYFRNQVKSGRSYWKEKFFHFDPTLLDEVKDETVLEGWFQSFKYFDSDRDLVHREFTFDQDIIPESQSVYDEIVDSESVCLNVRRTDFLNVDILNTTNLPYFLNAVDRMSELVKQPKYFVFSDDMDWCQNNIKLNHSTIYIGHEHKGIKFGNYMQLMKACKHFIIPNSSFAWWAVWLNGHAEKKVIAPKKWFNDTRIDTSDLVPDTWIRI